MVDVAGPAVVEGVVETVSPLGTVAAIEAELVMSELAPTAL